MPHRTASHRAATGCTETGLLISLYDEILPHRTAPHRTANLTYGNVALGLPIGEGQRGKKKQKKQ